MKSRGRLPRNWPLLAYQVALAIVVGWLVGLLAWVLLGTQ
jgi:hypothetical protein